MPRKKGSPNHLLKSARLLRGLSQEEVASAIGTNSSKVAEWELGYSKPRNYAQRKLCALFSMTPKEPGFLIEEPPTKPFDSYIYDPATPSPIQGFAGRHELLESLKKRLFDSQNVVLSALHGLPGVGKTSIAVKLAYDPDVQLHFSDGVLWAGVGRWDPNNRENIREILRRWGRLLGLSDAEMAKLSSDDKAWVMAIGEAISRRRMLLILDDIWHIEHVEALRVGGSSSQYLITTRRPSIVAHFVDEERMLVPELDEVDSVALLAHYVPHLVKTEPENIQKLVQAVGGLPLALKLMGSYLSSQAYSHQHRRIDNALKKLRDVEERLQLHETKGVRDRHPSLPDRETISLQAVIGVSDEALQEHERQVLRAFSIFPPKPNTFSEEAALEIATTSSETLDYLTDIGLVEVSRQGRYTLHQTIADYAKVRRTDETVGMRMADYFARYVDATSRTSERVLDIDEANINEALKLVHEQAYDKLVIKLCIGMRDFWRNGGRRDASLHYLPWGIQAAKEIAKATQQREDYLAEADLTYAYGQVLFQIGSLEADQVYRDSLAIYQKIGEQESEGIVLSALGRLSLSRGKMKDAEDYCQQALRIHHAKGNEVQMGVDLSSLAQIAIDCGQLEKAEQYLEAAASTRLQGRARRIDCIEWGRIAVARKRLDEAEGYFQEALKISQNQAGKEREMDLRGEAASFNWLGLVALGRGQFEKSKALLQEALAIHRKVQDPEGEALALFRLALLAEIQGDLDSAEKQYQASLDIFLTAQLDRHSSRTRSWNSAVSSSSGKADERQDVRCFCKQRSFLPGWGYILLRWISLVSRKHGR